MKNLRALTAKVLYKLFSRRPEARDYHKTILTMGEANDRLRGLVESSAPIMVSRLGGTELKALRYFDRQGCRDGTTYPANILEDMRILSGFYPSTSQGIDTFARLYFRALPETDLMGVWFNSYEDVICRKYSPNAVLAPLASLEPYYHDRPWSAALAGKTVLVVHPFDLSIGAQYARREALFRNPSVLPAFKLITFRPVQSLADQPTSHSDWFAALETMCKEIGELNFDIAIIGAGAYGLPLASFVKCQLRRKAIHLGGAVQILFGIKGNRWDAHPVISSFYNDSWVRPRVEERVAGARRVENACYW